MNKKKVLIFSLLTAALAVGSFISVNKAKGVSLLDAEGCIHEGNHYAAHDATCTEAGNKEFWACCKCQTQFLSNPGGTWTDKTTLAAPLESTHVAYAAPEHVYDETGSCTGTCGGTIVKDYSLTNPRKYITTKTLGLEDPFTTNNEGGHKFITYDFKNSGDFEILVDMTYDTPKSGVDSYILFYLFNGGDERGAVLRINTSRVEDDGIALAYIFKMDSSIQGDLVQGAGSAGTSFYFPRVSGIKSTNEHNYFSIYADLVDASTCEYNLSFRGGNSLDNLRYASANAEDKLNTEKVFNVTFGANYTTSYSKLRITNTGLGQINAVLHDVVPADRTITYVLNNVAIGNKSFATNAAIDLPKMRKTGYKFLGWFTQNGVKVTDDLANGYYTIAPRFVQEEGRNLKTLSDFNYAGETIAKCGEKALFTCAPGAGVSRIDIAMIYTPNLTTGDTYVILGFPYDFVDRTTRLYTRFQLGNTDFRGYVYGGSLGAAGADGTFFADTAFKMTSGKNYLLTFSFALTDDTGLNFTNAVQMQDLETGALSQSIERTGSFTGGRAIDFTNVNHCRFAVSGLIDGENTGSSIKLSTAW